MQLDGIIHALSQDKTFTRDFWAVEALWVRSRVPREPPHPPIPPHTEIMHRQVQRGNIVNIAAT